MDQADTYMGSADGSQRRPNEVHGETNIPTMLLEESGRQSGEGTKVKVKGYQEEEES